MLRSATAPHTAICSKLFGLVAAALLAVGAVPLAPSCLAAQDNQLSVELGFGGSWKLGHLVPLRVDLPAGLRAAVQAVEVRSVDGDGVEVTYRTEIEPSTSVVDGPMWIPIRIGRQSATLVVRVVGTNEVLIEQSFETDELGQSLPSSQPLIVAIGASMGVEQVSLQSADGSSSTFSTVVLERAMDVPVAWVDYSSVDLVILSSSDVGLLRELQPPQWQALDQWLRRGGGAVISVGATAEGLEPLRPLTDLLPGPIVGVGRIQNPAALESLIATDQPLRDFPCSLIDVNRGRIELTLTDTLSREVPWWISYSHGHGTLRFIASDLGHESFEAWEDRRQLWKRVLAPYLDRATVDGSDETQVGDSSYLGYNDLVGQLRATLDLFPEVRVVAFGQVAAILVGILILIGPVDYLVSVKWLKRPDLSWIFTGAALLAISAGLTWLYGMLRPREVHVNTVQVIDVDEAAGQVNGRLWSHVYSGAARQVDVEVRSLVSDAPIRVDWQGLPGRGLGGLLSQLNADRGMPAYRIEQQVDGKTRIEGVGMPAAGTKVLYAAWQDDLQLTAKSDLREIAGVDQLEGQLANPLPVDLLEPVLFYHNWYYSLNSRIPAGQSVTVSFDTIPKDIARRLNGRRTIDGNESTTPWNPADRNSVDRLLELMMFHKAAAGKTYTSLAHRYEPLMDFSNLLQTDRAILLGRTDQPWASVVVSDGGADAGDSSLRPKQNLDRTWCRVAIPVKRNSGR